MECETSSEIQWEKKNHSSMIRTPDQQPGDPGFSPGHGSDQLICVLHYNTGLQGLCVKTLRLNWEISKTVQIS